MRMPILAKLATEDIVENATAPNEVVEAPVNDGVETLEAQVVTINDELVDMGEQEATIDDAAEVVEEMEVAAESLRIIAQNGGLDRNGAQVLNLYQESLNKRVGYPLRHKALSVESFGNTHSRIGATNLAIESFVEKAKELWKKIVEMFKKAVESLGVIWNKLFDGATKMRARAENLVKVGESIKGEATEKTFEQPKLAEALHINGQVNVGDAVDMLKYAAAVLQAATERSIKAVEGVSAAVEGGDQSKLKTVASDARKIFPSKVSDPAAVGLSAPGEGLEMYREDKPWPGNRALIVTVPATDDAKPDLVAKIKFQMGMFDASKKVGDKVALNVLTPSEIVQVAKNMLVVADDILKYKPEQKKAEDLAKKVTALAEKKANESATADGKPVEGQLAGSDARNLCKGGMSMLINMAPPLAGYVINTGNAALQYLEQSAKQYGKAKAEAPAPAAETKPA